MAFGRMGVGTMKRESRLFSGAQAYGGRPGTMPSGAALPGIATMMASKLPGTMDRGRDLSMAGSRGNQHTPGAGGHVRGAGGAMGFLRTSATGFADSLLPQLTQGLRLARGRFTGGNVNSGAAQAAEQGAFSRLFADPLQRHISQLSGQALQFGEGQRRFDTNQSFRERQHGDYFGLARDQFGESRRQFDAQLGLNQGYLDLANREHLEGVRQFNAQQRARRFSGVGRVLGQLAGRFIPGL